MSKIVERMARAYCAADGSEPDWFMRDEDGKERERTEGRNEWLRQLRQSLASPTP
jgi:hypothetical protein